MLYKLVNYNNFKGKDEHIDYLSKMRSGAQQNQTLIQIHNSKHEMLTSIITAVQKNSACKDISIHIVQVFLKNNKTFISAKT